MKGMKANRSLAEAQRRRGQCQGIQRDIQSSTESANCCDSAVRWSLLRLRLLVDAEAETRLTMKAEGWFLQQALLRTRHSAVLPLKARKVKEQDGTPSADCGSRVTLAVQYRSSRTTLTWPRVTAPLAHHSTR